MESHSQDIRTLRCWVVYRSSYEVGEFIDGATQILEHFLAIIALCARTPTAIIPFALNGSHSLVIAHRTVLFVSPLAACSGEPLTVMVDMVTGVVGMGRQVMLLQARAILVMIFTALFIHNLAIFMDAIRMATYYHHHHPRSSHCKCMCALNRGSSSDRVLYAFLLLAQFKSSTIQPYFVCKTEEFEVNQWG